MQNFLKYLEEAEKTTLTIDHLVYVTFPLIKDKRLLLKALSEMKDAILSCVNSILCYEHFYKRISMRKNSLENFKIFVERCALPYEITQEEIILISNLFNLVQKHKESGFEFMRHEKVVILSGNLETEVITIEKIKFFLAMLKGILKKIKTRFFGKI